MRWNIWAGKNREGFTPQQLQRGTFVSRNRRRVGRILKKKKKKNEQINEKCDYLRRHSLDEIVGKRALNL